MGNKDKYWERRNAGLCVACGEPAGGKSRCQKCMKDLGFASVKSKRLKIQRLEDRIRDLEAAAGRLT
jgi:hypothetical protein